MLLVLVRSPRLRYVSGCLALIAIVAAFAVTLLHFFETSGENSGTAGKLTLPSWNERPTLEGGDQRALNLDSFIPWLPPIWLLGVCLFQARYVAGWLLSERLRRRAVCKAPDAWQRLIASLAIELKVSRAVVLLESLLADSPVVLGHLRPVVLVPFGFLTNMSPEHVEAILLHELAHIRRSDYLVNVCQRLIESLLFYHPAIWWISHMVRIERENCCDDMVLRLRPNTHAYATALTILEQNRIEQQWPAANPAAGATGGNLVKRVKRLLHPRGATGIWAPTLATIVLMASTAMVLSAWHLNLNKTAASNQVDQGPQTSWRKWLNEDVVYIISDDERSAFERLKTDEERQRFVDQFWLRRDPTVSTPENEFKEEHYRRIAYANDHWGQTQAGWKTDRGRIYIRYGPPDEIDSHRSGGIYNRPSSDGGGAAMTYPFEDWLYSHFEGVGRLSIEFVDSTQSGELRMSLNPSEKYKK